MPLSRPVEYINKKNDGSALGLCDAREDEFAALRWRLDETRELSWLEQIDGASKYRRLLDAALGAVGGGARTLDDGTLAFVETVDEVWLGMCECELVTGARDRLFVLVGMTHHSDRWGQTSTSATSVVVHVASGRVLLALESADDPYGMISSFIRHIERDGATSIALAALLLYAPEPFVERWEGIGQREGFEWVEALIKGEVFHVDGAPLDACLEYF